MPAEACDQLTAGTQFWVRLTDPLSSYDAKPGTLVRGLLLKSPECEKAPVLSTKVPIEGKVLSVHRVGLGLWHETATLEIVFSRLLPSGRSPIEISGRVKLVDNARERVKNGVIQGIRSTDTPEGRISSRLKYLPSLHLYPDPFLLGYKLFFPVFPEPEIDLKPGCDIEVELTQSAILPTDLPPVAETPALEQNPELVSSLKELPDRSSTKSGNAADVVNVVFVGSLTDLENAFQAAGWQQSDPVSPRAVLRQFYAFLARASYANAPISSQFLEGRKPDLTMEKAFDSNEKRNHIRIWELENKWQGMPLFASAAVRETGATLSIRHKGFIHHVSEDLGEEQQTVLRDLSVAGCVESVGSVARPAMEHVLRNATGEFFRTDGLLLLVRLKPCVSDPQGRDSAVPPSSKHGTRAFRYLRREILTVRSDLWRANCIYALFDLTRMTVRVLGRNTSHRIAQ
jgi:LssY C-terminus